MLVTMDATKNTTLTLITPVFDAAEEDYKSSAAGLDSEISQDSGGFADCTNELTEIGTSGVYTLILTAAEMNVDLVGIRITSTSTGYKIPFFAIQTELGFDGANVELAAIPTTVSSGRQMLQFVFEYIRNRKRVTATSETLYKEDAATELGSSVISDDGTVYSKSEMS